MACHIEENMRLKNNITGAQAVDKQWKSNAPAMKHNNETTVRNSDHKHEISSRISKKVN